MISPDEQRLLRKSMDNLHKSLNAIESLVKEYGDDETKRLFAGAEFNALRYISRLRKKFNVPFYPKKERVE